MQLAPMKPSLPGWSPRRGCRGWLLALGLLLAPLLAEAQTVLVLGDSISAAYGIQRELGWVALLQQKLPEHTVINASISGETTEGGRSRLPALLAKHQPDIVIVELGGNDGLRGFQIRRIRDNLDQLVALSQDAGAEVLLAAMKIPPNYGPRYTAEFYESFELTAKRFDIPLAPFILAGVATRPELMQGDGIHPTAEAQHQLLDNIWPHLQPLLDDRTARPALR
jgi:acyl-CoA thioesterase-1